MPRLPVYIRQPSFENRNDGVYMHAYHSPSDGSKYVDVPALPLRVTEWAWPLNGGCQSKPCLHW